jgi:Mn2+/Fe2+ NRAMP family transporter
MDLILPLYVIGGVIFVWRDSSLQLPEIKTKKSLHVMAFFMWPVIVALEILLNVLFLIIPPKIK